jgi:hypothetical protein
MSSQAPDPQAAFACGVLALLVAITLTVFLCILSIPFALFLLAGA